MDREVWLATSQDWCFLELSIGKRCLLELRDKGFEISPGGKRGEKKIVVSTNNLKKKKKVQLRAFNLTQNSCYLLFMHLGLDFPSLLMQSLLDFSKRGPLVHCCALSHGCLKGLYSELPGCQFPLDISTQVLPALSQVKIKGPSYKPESDQAKQPVIFVI